MNLPFLVIHYESYDDAVHAFPHAEEVQYN